MEIMVLLDLMGGVALLLWGLHMVRSGIMRAFGSDLRRVLSHALGNRLSAFLAGIGITAVLQSSTATNLMTTTFVTRGVVARNDAYRAAALVQCVGCFVDPFFARTCRL